MMISYLLIISISVHIICQAFKVVYYSIKNRKFSLKYLVSAGGMPSTHSAFSGTLTVSLGLLYGFGSEFFAIAFVFTAIVVYDSLRLRGAVQIHSDILRELAVNLPEEKRKKIPSMVGHTLSEIIVGISIALVSSIAGFFIKEGANALDLLRI